MTTANEVTLALNAAFPGGIQQAALRKLLDLLASEVTPQTQPVDLTAATGVTGNTVADVGAAFSQATLNNNFKVVADKINAINDALKASGVFT
jgi:type III secretory pathway component EscU